MNIERSILDIKLNSPTQFAGAKSATYTTLEGDQFWFSYDTCIAFRAEGKLTIIKNLWSNTTGRHLNAIDKDKSKRVDQEVFNKRLEVLGLINSFKRL
ncbi:MAG: hypothetical protein DRO67_00655 [Candidatus Asgardarchaeum californiense]|nr:MAG: hypothetical protein DRO67_00655 [Candidatus Asgardarchaeum californiense]